MATNDPRGEDPTAEPHSDRPGPESGGCLNFGWGCLPLVAAILALPAGLFF